MNRSFREIVELVLFGLIALLVVTGLFWLIGWGFTGIGIALKWLSGLLWMVLKFAIPVALVGALFYFLVRFIQKNQANSPAADATPAEKVETVVDNAKEAAAETVEEAVEAAKNVAETVEDTAEEVIETGAEKVEEAAKTVSQKAKEVTEDAKEAADKAKKAAEEVADDVKEAADDAKKAKDKDA